MSLIKKLMKRCPVCLVYTLQEKCSECGAMTRSPHPPKFSMERDRKYSKYRRFYKYEKKMSEGTKV